MFISFEGTEGVGKTSVIKGVSSRLSALQIAHTVTREPGGTPLAENIRSLLLERNNECISTDCELLLLFSSRAQHIAQVILPAIARREYILCDRYIDSTYAYQFGGRALPRSKLDVLCEHFVPVMPDKTLWLDAPVELGMQRAAQRGEADRFEQEKYEFFSRVRQQFAERQKAEPNRIIRIDASLSQPDVFAQVTEALYSIIDSRTSSK